MGLLLTYGLTIGADIANGGDVTLVGSVIPVVGPFYAIISEKEAKGYEGLLALSGVIQSAFFIDYLVQGSNLDELKNRKVSVAPMPNKLGMMVSYKF